MNCKGFPETNFQSVTNTRDNELSRLGGLGMYFKRFRRTAGETFAFGTHWFFRRYSNTANGEWYKEVSGRTKLKLEGNIIRTRNRHNIDLLCSLTDLSAKVLWPGRNVHDFMLILENSRTKNQSSLNDFQKDALGIPSKSISHQTWHNRTSDLGSAFRASRSCGTSPPPFYILYLWNDSSMARGRWRMLDLIISGTGTSKIEAEIGTSILYIMHFSFSWSNYNLMWCPYVFF